MTTGAQVRNTIKGHDAVKCPHVQGSTCMRDAAAKCMHARRSLEAAECCPQQTIEQLVLDYRNHSAIEEGSPASRTARWAASGEVNAPEPIRVFRLVSQTSSPQCILEEGKCGGGPAIQL